MRKVQCPVCGHQFNVDGKGATKATITAREAAKYMGISLDTVYDMIWKGNIPSRRVGNKFIISRQWIVNFVENGESTPVTHRKKI